MAKVITNEMVDGLGYDYLTGDIYRTRDMKRWKSGSVVGAPDKDGYLTFARKMGGGHQLKNHRAIFTIIGNPLGPDDVIDHINGVPDDNILENLRVGTQADNCMNKVVNRAGKLVGASKNKSGTFSGYIKIKGVSKNLGTFKTELEAHEAYLSARKGR